MDLGERHRPVDLEVFSVYNFADRPQYGAHLGATLVMDDGLGLHASYRFERLETTRPAGAVPSSSQGLALGLGYTF